jgi:hypothetical protein
METKMTLLTRRSAQARPRRRCTGGCIDAGPALVQIGYLAQFAPLIAIPTLLHPTAFGREIAVSCGQSAPFRAVRAA